MTEFAKGFFIGFFFMIFMIFLIIPSLFMSDTAGEPITLTKIQQFYRG